MFRDAEVPEALREGQPAGRVELFGRSDPLPLLGPSAAPGRSERFVELDFICFFAATSVMVYHYKSKYIESLGSGHPELAKMTRTTGDSHSSTSRVSGRDCGRWQDCQWP
jgi:hypothetical protein